MNLNVENWTKYFIKNKICIIFSLYSLLGKYLSAEELNFMYTLTNHKIYNYRLE